ncbi:MAG: class I SAM-dependent methyltransferase [Clostridiales bacterium]|nr:class I SAM-dependent methyltransferase [Clostridiales bacterium]
MYTAFASVYDQLMADVDYLTWARFYHALMDCYGIPRGKVCECACGTGSITIPLSQMGYQMTGVDLSPDMLFEASQKARKSGAMIPFVKQDMRTLHLHRSMDAVLCSNDGINYLKDQGELFDFFTAAFAAVREGGGLFLDLSTPYKIENILGNHFIGDETSEIAYLWQNRFSQTGRYVDLNLAIFVRQKDETYIRVGEHQRQYAHDANTIAMQMESAGFTDIRIFADKKLEAPSPKELRWFIGAKKPVLPDPTAQPPAFSPQEHY